MSDEKQNEWNLMVKRHHEVLEELANKALHKEISKAFYFQEIERLTEIHLREIKELLGDEV